MSESNSLHGGIPDAPKATRTPSPTITTYTISTTHTHTEIRIPSFASNIFHPRPDVHLPSADDFPRDQDQPPKVYTLDHLPPPGIISSVLDAFYSCSGTMFYIISRQDSFDLFRSLYWGQTRRTKAALAEICAIAAVGSQYDCDGVSQAHRCAFLDTAKIYSDDLIEASELRAMRLYALCSMYSIMEKRIAAWSYVAAGLKIAQSYGLHKAERPMGIRELEWVPLRKCWRTLKFLESWLSGTLGLLPDTECNAHPDACSIASSTAFPIEKGNHAAVNMKLDLDMIQSQLAKVGFLMGEIVKNVYAAGVCSIRSIETYVEKLEEWHKDLPQYMRLETLLGEESEPVTKRAVLLVHLVYLGSIILVTRKMITELVRRPAGSPWKFDGTKEEAVHYMELCIASAKSIAMIVGILYDDNVISKRCWMILNQSFNALTILLFHVVQKRRHQQPLSEYIEYLHDCAKIVRVILFCSTGDNLAHAYLRVLRPFGILFEIANHPDLTDVAFSLHPDYSYDPSARMAPILQELDNSELDALAQHLLHILHTPFGGKGAVESRPNISVQQLHSDRETTHARFWDLGGWRASPWPSNRDTEALPLKRLYEEPVRNLGSLGEEAKKRKAEELEALFGRVV